MSVPRLSSDRDTPPSASGPAGAELEVQVATHYALCLLAQSEARGLPGVSIHRIEFQRGKMGHPLDDVIIHGRDAHDRQCTLDIQVKRSLTFRASNTAFQAVVHQIAETLAADDASQRRRFAVAIQRTDKVIETGVQETLQWARAAPDVKSFFEVLNSPGRSNEAMRGFVKLLRAQLKGEGAFFDDAAMFNLLSRFQVLIFDYNRPGSSWEYFDRDRAARLIQTDASPAGSPYEAIQSSTQKLDAAGGATTREHLQELLRESGCQLTPLRRLVRGRRRLIALSQSALKSINTRTAGFHLNRTGRLQQLEAALDMPIGKARVVVAIGGGGVGKSALLRSIAERRSAEAAITVLAPGRTIENGWEGLRHSLDVDATAEEFLADLACDGGTLVCIDGIDRFSNPKEQATVSDVLLAALATEGVKVLITARPGWDRDGLTWLPDDILDAASGYVDVDISEIDDDEAALFAEAVPGARDLLAPGHPARSQARNFIRLRRLLGRTTQDQVFHTEAEMAVDWWRTGDGGPSDEESAQTIRRRVLRHLAEGLIAGQENIDVANVDAGALSQLREKDAIHIDDLDRATFAHDVLSDWAIGCLLSSNTDIFETFDLSIPPPIQLTRGVEMSARILVENSERPGAWTALIEKLSADGVHRTWRRWALMALVRSEFAAGLLVRHCATLFANNGDLATELIQRTIASESKPAKPMLVRLGIPEESIPLGLLAPASSAWLPLTFWSAKYLEQMPGKSAAAAMRLFEHWMTARLGRGELCRTIFACCVEALEVERRESERPMFERARDHMAGAKYLSLGNESLERARELIGLFARQVPDLAARYLDGEANGRNVSYEFRRIMRNRLQLPFAAPEAFARLILAAVENVKAKDEQDRAWGSRKRNIFSPLESGFIEPQPGAGPFLAILQSDPDAGLALVHTLVDVAIDWATRDEARPGDSFELELAGENRVIHTPHSYFWPRGGGVSPMLSSALMSMELWAQQAVEAGADTNETIHRVLGEGDTAAAFVAIAVDILLSQSGGDVATICDLLSCPELLALDATRLQHDAARGLESATSWIEHTWDGDAMPPAAVQVEQKKQLARKGSRGRSLHHLIGYAVRDCEEDILQTLQSRVEAGQERLGDWTDDSVKWGDPVYMASHTLWALDPEHYHPSSQVLQSGEIADGIQLVMPEGQAAWLKARDEELTSKHGRLIDGLAVRQAADDADPPSADLIDRALRVMEQTSDATPASEGEDRSKPEDPWLARLGACALIARAGSGASFKAWRKAIEEACARAVAEPHRDHYNLVAQVCYDAQALAITAMIYTAGRMGGKRRGESLISAIAEHGQCAANAFMVHTKALLVLGDKWPGIASRIGLETSFRPHSSRYDDTEEAAATRQRAYYERLRQRVVDETAWLQTAGDKPDWPTIPSEHMATGDGDGGTPKLRQWPDTFFDHHRASRWTSVLVSAEEAGHEPIDDLLDVHMDWLAVGNGASGNERDSDRFEHEWTDAVFRLAASRALHWNDATRDRLIFNKQAAYSDESFLSAAAAFLVHSDLLNIMGDRDRTEWLVTCRQRIWSELARRQCWRQHTRSTSFGVEWRLSELVAAFFCKADWGFRQTSYLGGLAPEQLVPFLNIQSEICRSANVCVVCALHFMDVLDVLPSQVIQGELLDALNAWVEGRGTDMRFWERGDLGRRICGKIDVGQVPKDRVVWLLNLMDSLCAAGVAEAAAIEAALRSHGE